MFRLLVILPFLFFFKIYASEGNGVDKYIGVNVNPSNHNLSTEEMLRLIETTGFNSFRQELSWGNVEDRKGNYVIKGKNIARDDLIKKSTALGLKPILVLVYSNKFYNDGNYPITPESRKAFANYAAWLANQYKGKVKVFEVWNEWTLGAGMTARGLKIPPESSYFELVKETSIALKKVDPEIKVITGSFNPMSPTGRYLDYNDTTWFLNLINLGILKYIDGVSIHPYSFLNVNKKVRTPEENFLRIEKLEKLLVTASGEKKEVPIYITEMGISNFEANGGASENSSADFIVKYTALISTLPYVKGIWWYNLIDDGNDIKEREQNFGFYHNNVTGKKVVEPFKQLMSKIRSGELDKCVASVGKSAVEIRNINSEKLKECMSWSLDHFSQYNRITGDFDSCKDCNNIKFSK